MKKNSSKFIAMFITLALSGGAATAGCGGGVISSLCEDICACQGCTSNDLKACEEQGDKTAEQADAVGCSSQFEAAVTCAGAHISCKETQALVTEGCDAEQAALAKCSSTISVLGTNACALATDVIAAKLKSCGLTLMPSDGPATPECTAALGAQSTCVAACYDAADCTTLNPDLGTPTSEQLTAVADCLTACS